MTGRPASSPSVAVLIGVLGFVITVIWLQPGAEAARTARRAELVAIVEARQQRALQYERELERLRARADALESRAGTAELLRLRSLTDAAAARSGATEVTGPGLVVTLSDSAASNRATLDTNSHILDVDLQAVVNALWRAGAEAIAIGGQRLVATSAIRNAGVAVLVNYRVLSSPYRIQAIGDPAAMGAAFDASQIAAHFREWTTIYGLGYSVARAGSLTLPPFGGSLGFRYAHPMKEG